MDGFNRVQLLPWLAAAFALAAAGAWLARRHALRHGLLDLPGERRSHRVPTPRGGGVGIALAWLLACIGLGAAGRLPWALASAAACGTLLVAAVGYADDHRPLSAWWRLVAHFGAGLVLAAGLLGSGAAPWLALLSVAAVPVLVNVWNFMDGINGLATSQALLAGVGLALLSGTQQPAPVVAPALVLAAACLGFLPFNFPRARIFLGDVGSGTLGFALAVLGGLLLSGAGQGEAPGLLLLAFLPLSAFMIDAALTLGRRIVRREQWWTAHVGHAYQRLAARVGAHAPVTLGYAAWTFVAIVTALAASGGGLAVKLAACAGCAAAGALAWCAVASADPREQKEAPDDDQLG